MFRRTLLGALVAISYLLFVCCLQLLYRARKMILTLKSHLGQGWMHLMWYSAALCRRRIRFRRTQSTTCSQHRIKLSYRNGINQVCEDLLLSLIGDLIFVFISFIEDTPELSAEEKRKRQEKVEAIKKMLSDSPNIAPNVSSAFKNCRNELDYGSR